MGNDPVYRRDLSRISEDVRQCIQDLRAGGLTLRGIAAAVGVSHETVRAILREPKAALAAD